MKGEDKIFLLEAVMALTNNRATVLNFMRDKTKSDRLFAIRDELGSAGFEAECIKLKKEGLNE